MPTWTRVRDVATGHTFDIDARTLPHRRGVEPVNDPDRWPDVEGPRAAPRPTKPFVGKDGKARPAPGEEAADTGGEDIPGEPAPAPTNTGRSRRSTTTTTPATPPADTSKETTS